MLGAGMTTGRFAPNPWWLLEVTGASSAMAILGNSDEMNAILMPAQMCVFCKKSTH